MTILRFSDRPFFNPWTEFERLRRELDRLAGGYIEEARAGRRASVFPPCNVTEDSEAIYVRAELPGLRPADVHITMEGETLTIKGEKSPAASAKVSYHRRELEHGTFSRSLTVPTRIAVEKITAQAKDGILTIVLPKAEEVKPRRIEVKVS